MSSSRPRSPSRGRRGGALVATLVTMMLAVALAYSAVSMTTAEQRALVRGDQKSEARALADAGVHRAMALVRETMNLDAVDPVRRLDLLLFTNGDPTQPILYSVAADAPVARNGRTYGTYSVSISAAANGGARDITITSTGYVPDRANARAKATTQAVVRAGTETAQVFDYGYFINNWGWFFGDALVSWGNARSNGQFDAANYKSGVHGSPRWDGMNLSNPASPDLVGYHDDNGDGLMDGSDGGIYSGWDVANAGNVLGIGGQAENQHSFQEQLAMPNLNDLTSYEARALAANASLSIGGGLDAFGMPLPPTLVCDGVLGDGGGELQNLVLIGTLDQPILLNGPVVVRGDVIIKGVVSGQGSIYAGRNIYIADDVTYLDGPSTDRPSDNSEATTEAWLAANAGKDFLGLFAKESVVMGDFTDAWWRYYVGWWLGHSMNQSAEDAGADQIPNTRNGVDGIWGTQDDDVLEGDGVFTTETYSQLHSDLGLIPAGKNIGDPIPGTGEDIDGDGAFDATLGLADFDLSAALDSGLWAGNLPAGTTGFDQISSMNMTQVDACTYTNHAAALLSLAWGMDFTIFGSMVSRNESLIYGTNTMNCVQDARMLAGGMFGRLLPDTIAPLEVIAWTHIDNDVKALTIP